MRSKEVDYEKLINENHDLKQKLENFIPRRRVRRIYKQVEKILKQDGIIDDLEDDDVIPKSKIRDKIKELEHEKSKRTQLGVFMLKNYENQRLLAQMGVLKEILGE